MIKYIRSLFTVVLFATVSNSFFGNLTREQIDNLQDLLNREDIDNPTFRNTAVAVFQTTNKHFLEIIRGEIAEAEQNAVLQALLNNILRRYQESQAEVVNKLPGERLSIDD